MKLTLSVWWETTVGRIVDFPEDEANIVGGEGELLLLQFSPTRSSL